MVTSTSGAHTVSPSGPDRTTTATWVCLGRARRQTARKVRAKERGIWSMVGVPFSFAGAQALPEGACAEVIPGVGDQRDRAEQQGPLPLPPGTDVGRP